jgi:hypothetical protein
MKMGKQRVLSLFFLLGLVGPVYGGPTVWKLGDEEIARYRIDQTKKAANKSQTVVKLPDTWPISSVNLKDQKTYREPVRGLDGLIYRYAFSVPTEIDSNDVATLEEKFASVGNHALNIDVKGKVRVKGSARKATFKGQISFSQRGKVGRSNVKRGTLIWTSLFDIKKGVLLSCNFDFSIEYSYKAPKKAAKGYHYLAAGRIILLGREKAKLSRFKKDVARAIQRGSQWLYDETKGNLSKWTMGKLALALFALQRSGILPSDSVIKQGFQKLSTMTPARTYDVAVYIMALEARSVKRIPPKGSSSVPRYRRKKVGKNDLQMIQRLANFLVRGRVVGYGRWDYTAVGGVIEEGGSTVKKGEKKTSNKSKRYDHSVTQFAVLALHAAHRAGAKIDRAVWREVFDQFKRAQSKSEGSGSHRIHKGLDRPRMGQAKRGGGTVERGGVNTEETAKTRYRGWGYTTGAAYGSMTNAGLSSLAIAASMLEEENSFSSEQEKEFKRMTREGLAWQAKNYTVTTNPKKGGNNHYYYYMYSLEKACELLGVEGFDGRSWYDDGARRLTIVQLKNGSWDDSMRHTSFALIFLNRGTLRTTVNILKRRRVTGEDDASDRTQVNVKGAGGTVDLNNLLEAIIGASRGEQKKLQKWFNQGLVQLQEVERPLVMSNLLELLSIKESRGFARRQLRTITQDSTLKTRDEFQKWQRRWQSLDQAGEQRAYGRIPLMKECLQGKNRILRQVAMLAAARLMAVELVPVIAALLDQPRERPLAANCLLSLMGRQVESRADAEEWADKQGPAALKEQLAVRQLFKAIAGDREAIKVVCAAGKKHLSDLVRIVKKKAFQKGAQSLLEKITGETKIKSEKWLDWWRKNEEKIGADGRLD